MEEQVVIEGTIEDIIYQNEENGYTVCTIEYEGEGLSCVGNMMGVYEGEEVKIIGTWSVHPVYGKQVKVDLFERSIPKTVQGMEKYLASGVIKGIGQKMAKKIVKNFGLDTFRIIEEEPLLLAQISGITEKRALKISELFHAQHELRKAMLFLQDYGITATYAIKIYKQYKDQTVEVIKNNPYRLAEDIIGIGFKKADEIAFKVGIPKEDPHRIKAGILYALTYFSGNGHTYVPKEILETEARKLLMVAPELIESAIMELNLYKQIVIKVYDDIPCVFLAYLYRTEEAVAQKLIELSGLYQWQDNANITKDLINTEKELGITLVEEQREAIRQALQHGVTVVTGGPGTGKTTTINALLHMLQKYNEDVILTAPTGRAAKRMSEATHQEAQTIHRLLEINYVSDQSTRQMFQRNDENPLEADVIIVDETSMVDIGLMLSLLKAIVGGQRLILIGDSDQLPSVGPGNVLRDIIKSGRIPVVKLTQIFRQARESAIVMNAHKINKGEYPVVNEKGTDFFFMQRFQQEQVVQTIVELMTTRLPQYNQLDPFKDIQVLAPMRKGLLGINELNKALQQALNPPSDEKPEKEYRGVVYRTGDRVMQIKNNYNTPWKVCLPTGLPVEEGVGVFNGDTGIIQEVDLQREILKVQFEDQKIVEYEFSQLDELELSYAITIHKSQGSEYPAVIIPIHTGPDLLFSRNLLYTAVTRAKKMVVGVGMMERVYRMVDNNREIQRYSNLERQLKHGI